MSIQPLIHYMVLEKLYKKQGKKVEEAFAHLQGKLMHKIFNFLGLIFYDCHLLGFE